MEERANRHDWWRHAVVYQIYPRSFADANGDGIGDIAGATSRLTYLQQLGVDAVWLTPWYLSPLADGGYDVADYEQIDPRLGTLADAENFIREATTHGIRTIIDIVPNHVSDQHPWFKAALASEPGSPERSRFWFHDGLGDKGNDMPTNWLSSFRGHTWTRTTNPDGTPGQWYLHLFTPEQPDLNWSNPDVRAYHDHILRFWFERGAAGVRVDSATLIIKDPALPDVDESQPSEPGHHPYIDRDGIHDVYRSWRATADSFDPPRIMVGEVWLNDRNRFANYLRPDEMHTAFNFDFMTRPWDRVQLRQSIDSTMEAHRSISAPATWVLSNHDVTRPVTRYGRDDSSFAFSTKRFGTPTDLALGARRARAAFLLCAALPGSLYIYQGEELGLPEDEELPLDALEDPMHFRSGGIDPGRDGCRVPLPWTADAATNFGFSSPGSTPAHPSWLPQPDWWGDYAAEREGADPWSMLSFYRQVIALRRHLPCLTGDDFSWLEDLPDTSFGFTRGHIACLVNFGPDSLALPGRGIAMTSEQPNLRGAATKTLGPDATAWVSMKEV